MSHNALSECRGVIGRSIAVVLKPMVEGDLLEMDLDFGVVAPDNLAGPVRPVRH